MEKIGMVSVWYGNFKNENEFNEYVSESYPEDENSDTLLISDFINDAGIDWYDEDFREGAFFENGEVKELIKRFSYGESFAKKVAAEFEKQGVKKANTIFLIYDFAYQPNKKHQSKLYFLGVFPYEKS